MGNDRHIRSGGIRRGNRRAVEKGGTAPISSGMADRYYAVALLSPPADPFIELSILPQRLCGLCVHMPLFIRGHCYCQMVHLCDSYTSDE